MAAVILQHAISLYALDPTLRGPLFQYHRNSVGHMRAYTKTVGVEGLSAVEATDPAMVYIHDFVPPSRACQLGSTEG